MARYILRPGDQELENALDKKTKDFPLWLLRQQNWYVVIPERERDLNTLLSDFRRTGTLIDNKYCKDYDLKFTDNHQENNKIFAAFLKEKFQMDDEELRQLLSSYCQDLVCGEYKNSLLTQLVPKNMLFPGRSFPGFGNLYSENKTRYFDAEVTDIVIVRTKEDKVHIPIPGRWAVKYVKENNKDFRVVHFEASNSVVVDFFLGTLHPEIVKDLGENGLKGGLVKATFAFAKAEEALFSKLESATIDPRLKEDIESLLKQLVELRRQDYRKTNELNKILDTVNTMLDGRSSRKKIAAGISLSSFGSVAAAAGAAVVVLAFIPFPPLWLLAVVAGATAFVTITGIALILRGVKERKIAQFITKTKAEFNEKMPIVVQVQPVQAIPAEVMQLPPGDVPQNNDLQKNPVAEIVQSEIVRDSSSSDLGESSARPSSDDDTKARSKKNSGGDSEPSSIDDYSQLFALSPEELNFVFAAIQGENEPLLVTTIADAKNLMKESADRCLKLLGDFSDDKVLGICNRHPALLDVIFKHKAVREAFFSSKFSIPLTKEKTTFIQNVFLICKANETFLRNNPEVEKIVTRSNTPLTSSPAFPAKGGGHRSPPSSSSDEERKPALKFVEFAADLKGSLKRNDSSSSDDEPVTESTSDSTSSSPTVHSDEEEVIPSIKKTAKQSFFESADGEPQPYVSTATADKKEKDLLKEITSKSINSGPKIK